MRAGAALMLAFIAGGILAYVSLVTEVGHAPAGAHDIGDAQSVPVTWTVGIDPYGGKDSTAGITAAFAAAAERGHKLLFPCGRYLTTGLVLRSPLHIEGVSQQCVVIIGISETNNVLEIAPSAAGFFISDLSFDRSVIARSGAGVRVDHGGGGRLERVLTTNQWVGFWLGATARSTCSSCVAESNYADGFHFEDESPSQGRNTAIQWQMEAPVSQFNDGWGYATFVRSGSELDTGQEFANAGSYANALGGFTFDGDANSSINDLVCRHCYSSSDGGPGFHFSRPGTNNILDAPFAELEGKLPTGRGQSLPPSHNGCGFVFDGGGMPRSRVTIAAGFSAQNSLCGLSVWSNSNLHELLISGFQAWGNGEHGSPYGLYFLSSKTRVILSGASASDDGMKFQKFGLGFANGAQKNTLASGSDFSENVVAGCTTAIPPGNKGGVIGSGC